jgi:hypothetical protein
MAENRDSAWLRKTLCDEIEALRAGRSDHVRAKGVAMLAREVLKSVEVEMVFRQQQAEMEGTPHAQLGALPLTNELSGNSGQLVSLEDQHPEDQGQTGGESEPLPELPIASEPQPDHEITEISGFKVGDRVFLPNGKHGTIKALKSSGRIDVTEETGGTFPYIARHLSLASTEPKVASPIKSPIVPQGPVPRFVAGRNGSGSR